jgi:hypothetical protein
MPNDQPPLKLEDRLILFAYFNDLFGAAKFTDLQAVLKDTAEGYDEQGRSHFYNTLKGRANLRVPADLLATCDESIKNDLAAINRGRLEPIRLRYFQYLAALYTELYLHWRATDRLRFKKRLNAFVAEVNRRMVYGAHYPFFNDDDLDKIAYWMATGSGKTLLLHLNYRQFFRYQCAPLDDVLLITPNEGLSAQHLDELAKSGLPGLPFSQAEAMTLTGEKSIRVIEITKFTEKKTGGGVSIDVDHFEGNSNLIFVDEGHKGAGGEAWKGYRDRLSANGFTFEYSATFGQAINIAQDPALLNEYSKSILFDYSYKYFWGDGYGKDYAILNLRTDTADDLTDTLLLGNLLSFYEQARCYADHRTELKPYHLELPLWIFVGSSVNRRGGYSESSEIRSDILRIVLFLRRALRNTGSWTTNTLQAILKGKSDLKDPEGRDIFEGRFDYVRELALKPGALLADVLKTVFHIEARTDLHLAAIKNADGEIGLRAGEADQYFGVINIGDTATFFKLAEAAGVSREEDDSFSDSLFNQINTLASRINVLIGSKKFIEGWSSWRVTSMGLLNMGKGEGTQIIQLFGRGVRLLGRDHSLKRSRFLPGSHPSQLPLLEKLNIFGVRANYMTQFRAYLEQEGIETEGFDEIPLPIVPNKTFLKNGLLVPRLKGDVPFHEYEFMPLILDDTLTVQLDLRPQIQLLESATTAPGLLPEAPVARFISDQFLPLLDWDKLYFAMLDYKAQKDWTNLAISKAVLRQILESKRYELYCAETDLTPRSFTDVARLETIALSLLRKYADRFYTQHRAKWESDQLEYRPLTSKDDNFQDYTVRIRRSRTAVIKQVRALIAKGKTLYEQDTNLPPNIHFDRHLYQPLLTAQHPDISSVPPGLNEGEHQFVFDLRQFFVANKALLKDKHIFLLRNLSRGRGIGFFEQATFYPDFILWIKQGDQQQIVFIDPKGIRNLGNFNDPKIQLHVKIKEIQSRLAQPNVSLDSFIISVTKFADIQHLFGDGQHTQADFTAHHVLFQQGEYTSDMFTMLAQSTEAFT